MSLEPCRCESEDLSLVTSLFTKSPPRTHAYYLCNKCGSHGVSIVDAPDNAPATAKKSWNECINYIKTLQARNNQSMTS